MEKIGGTLEHAKNNILKYVVFPGMTYYAGARRRAGMTASKMDDELGEKFRGQFFYSEGDTANSEIWALSYCVSAAGVLISGVFALTVDALHISSADPYKGIFFPVVISAATIWGV
jgi:hypothetical protein